MQIISVNYELKKPGGNYEKLYETLKSYNCMHPMTSCWLLKTNESTDIVYNKLKSFIDGNDCLLVDTLSVNRAGCLSQEAIDWLSS